MEVRVEAEVNKNFDKAAMENLERKGNQCVACMKDIKALIIHCEKDSNLGRQLHLQLQNMLSRHKIQDYDFDSDNKPVGTGRKLRKDPQVLLDRLKDFRRHIMYQLAESPVIQSPTVVLVRLKHKIKPEPFSEADNEKQQETEDNLNLYQDKAVTKKQYQANEVDDEISKQIFPCSICKKIFHKKGHMTRHLLTHEPLRPFPCDFCTKRFQAKYSLQVHLSNHHKIHSKPFKCVHLHCDRKFTLKKELDRHALSHSRGFHPRDYLCNLCKLRFATKEDFNSHRDTHPDQESVFRCGQCEKIFPRKYNLERHERTHSLEKPYHCNVCSKNFQTKSALRSHLKLHETDEKQLSCPFINCGKRFTVQQNLDQHMSFHSQSDEKPYPCHQCDVRFRTQKLLEKHFEIEAHQIQEVGELPCRYCTKTFYRKYNLQRHEFTHTHGRRKPKDGFSSTIEGGDEYNDKYATDSCGSYDNTVSNRNSIASSSTMLIGEEVLYCEQSEGCFSNQCEEADSTFTNLNSEEDSIICKIRNECFEKRDELRVYTEIHDMKNHCVLEGPNNCINTSTIDTHPCEVRFQSPERLDMDTQGQFPCGYCWKTFPRNFNRVRHELSHTQGRLKPKEGLPIKIRHDDKNDYDQDTNSNASYQNEDNISNSISLSNFIREEVTDFDQSEGCFNSQTASNIKSKDSLICKMCGECFERDDELRLHIENHRMKNDYDFERPQPNNGMITMNIDPIMTMVEEIEIKPIIVWTAVDEVTSNEESVDILPPQQSEEEPPIKIEHSEEMDESGFIVGF